MKRQEKEKKKLTKKQKIILLVTLLIILVIGVVVKFLLFKPKEEKIDVTYNLTNDFEPIINKNEDGTYHIFGANKNQTFEVEPEDNFLFKITDEEGKEISTTTTKNENKITINAPEGLYEEGKEYKITISNGVFTNEELKAVKEITFSIKRNASNRYKFKEGIKEVKENDIKINENILTSDTEYQKNDIIVVKENDHIKSYYKVENKKDNGTYEVSIPDLSQVYDEFDFYGVETIDLSNFETDESLKEYIAYEVRKSILDYLVEDVQAKTKILIKDPSYDKKTGRLTLTVTISSEAGDKVFGKKFLDNHDMSMELKATIRLDVYNDVGLGSFDTGVKLYLELTPKANIDYRDSGLAKYRKNIEEALQNDTKDWNASWIKNDYKNLKKDSVDYKPELGKLAVPTTIPGIYVNFTTGLLFDFDVKASLEASVTTKMEANFGIRMNRIGKKNGLYGNFKSSGDMTGSFAGEIETKVGLNTSAGIELANIAFIKATLGSGLYTDALWTLSSKTNNAKKEIITTLDSSLEGGLFVDFNVEGKAFTFDGSLNLYEGKVKLIDEKASFEVGKLSLGSDTPVVKPEEKPQTPDKPQVLEKPQENPAATYRYTASEVRQKLLTGFEKAEKFGSYEDNGNSPYTHGCGGYEGVMACYTTKMNVDSNIYEIKNSFGDDWDTDNYIGYTCYYNYVNDTLSCLNYSNTKNKLQSLCQSEYDYYQNYKNEGYDLTDYYGYGKSYNTVSQCVNYFISGSDSDKKYYKNKINKILNAGGLTKEDLGVLK